MGDFLSDLAARATDRARVLRPRPPSLFEPTEPGLPQPPGPSRAPGEASTPVEPPAFHEERQVPEAPEAEVLEEV